MLKTKFFTRKDVESWIGIANLFAQSEMPWQEAIQSFNKLSKDDRIRIRNEFFQYDEYRRASIPKELSDKEKEDTFCKMVFVDIHIIATEYNTTPLAAAMCIRMPCSPNDRVIVKGW